MLTFVTFFFPSLPGISLRPHTRSTAVPTLDVEAELTLAGLSRSPPEMAEPDDLEI